MKRLVKTLFFSAWLISIILVGYMVYITVQSTYRTAELWAYIVMYSFTLIGSSVLTYNVLFPRHND